MKDEEKNKYFKSGRAIGYENGLREGYAKAFEVFSEKLTSLAKSVDPKTYKPLKTVCWGCGTGLKNE